jgi:cold shock CspA family protein/uncharacterized LabA/DUF88 family protein
MSEVDQKLLRVGVFYDGNFFFHVSNYYRYVHPRKKRLSIPGLHEFIRHHAAMAEGVDVRYCQIVDAHFFRGRLSAAEADARQKLYYERVFDDILMGEGVVTHYLPIRRKTEKGIDVWLALEAYELTVYKRFNVLVVIGGDSDFVPLARKINSLGTRVMVLGWDFKYTDDQSVERETVTSIHLLDEVTYPVLMHHIIDDKTRRDDPLVRNLFVEPRPVAEPLTRAVPGEAETPGPPEPAIVSGNGNQEGEILSLHQGYGFIRAAAFPNNVFFHWQSTKNVDFNDLKKGSRVRFTPVAGPKGAVAQDVEVIPQ